MAKAEDLLAKARMNLVLRYPFFGILALKLKFISDPSGGGAGTLGVNARKELMYNPKFIEKLSLRDTAIVLMHEIGHLVQSCQARMPMNANHMIWNLAADFAVNSWIVETELCNSKNILDDIFPEKIRPKYKNRSTEEIYLELLKDSDSLPQVKQLWSESEGDLNDSGKHKSNGLGCKGAESCGKNASTEEIKEIIRDIQSAAEAAKERKESKGSIPGFIEDFLAKLAKPTVRWTDHLRRTAYQTFKGRYTWNRPSRRSEAIKMRLPGRKPTPKGAIVAIDTSGSISKEMLVQFLSECAGIIRASGAPWVDIYFHDVNCYHNERFTAKTLNKIKVQRGGTSHVDVIQKIQETKKKIGIVICFTDLMTSFPDKPKFDVIWAVPSRYISNSVPWGKKLEVKMHGY